MAENNEVRQAVEQAVARVLTGEVSRLQAEIVQSVVDAVPEPTVPVGSGEAGRLLLHGVTTVHSGNTQKEILRALIEGGSAHCARAALFVVKAGMASGWQGRGFADDESVKDFPLDMNAGPVAHAYQNRVVAPANIAEMGRKFIDHFGAPSNEQVLVLPLVLKDKVAALIYADGGSTGVLDGTSLEVLVMATSAWLEVVSLRKQAQAPREAAEAASERAYAPPPQPVQTVSSFSDPFASHAPKHVPARVPEPEPAAEVVEVASVVHAAPSAAAAPAAAADPFAGLSPEDADTHRKAQRFARLLVDEIKLYNQAKVAEGRKHKDLYDRMKEDIEKSRATYQKRYGSTIANAPNYFQQELVRSLAEDDISIMGANFKR